MIRLLPLFHQFTLYINGSNGLFAWGLFLAGVFAIQEMGNDIDLRAGVYLQGQPEIGTGTITKVERTNVAVMGRDVMRYDYLFHSPAGDVAGTSYSADYEFETGQSIKVEYSEDRPEIHRIAGMTNTSGGGVYFLFLLPLIIGLVWIVVNMAKGKKRIRIIQQGEFAMGTFINKEGTWTKINRRRVYKMTFRFTALNGEEYDAVTKTHRPENISNKQGECLVYDPNDPEKSLMIGTLPWMVPTYIKKHWCPGQIIQGSGH